MDIETETKLLSQEHRLFSLIRNFYTRSERFPDPNDPRRKACESALFWNALGSMPVVALGGSGLVGFLSLYFLWNQNILLKESNALAAKSVSPEPVYFASVSTELRVLRAVTEENRETIQAKPIGIGSVLLADLAISCSGNNPLLIKKIRVDVTFRGEIKTESVRFVPHPVNSYRQVIKPGEISLIDLRLIPEFEKPDEILRWTSGEPSFGDISIFVSGQDLLGETWGLTARRDFACHVEQVVAPLTHESELEYLLSIRPDQTPQRTALVMANSERNPNRIIGTLAIPLQIKTKRDELDRIISRMERNWDKVDDLASRLRLY